MRHRFLGDILEKPEGFPAVLATGTDMARPVVRRGAKIQLRSGTRQLAINYFVQRPDLKTCIMLPKLVSDCFGASGIKTICRLVHECKYPEAVREAHAERPAMRNNFASIVSPIHASGNGGNGLTPSRDGRDVVDWNCDRSSACATVLAAPEPVQARQCRHRAARLVAGNYWGLPTTRISKSTARGEPAAPSAALALCLLAPAVPAPDALPPLSRCLLLAASDDTAGWPGTADIRAPPDSRNDF
jgi:hypothetical protein